MENRLNLLRPIDLLDSLPGEDQDPAACGMLAAQWRYRLGVVVLILEAGLFAISQSVGGAISAGQNPIRAALYGPWIEALVPDAWVQGQSLAAFTGMVGGLLTIILGRFARLGLLFAGVPKVGARFRDDPAAAIAKFRDGGK